jgi:hypothetical protein
MKKTIIASLSLLYFSISVLAQSTDEIISKHIEAIGGKSNWDKIQSMRTEGTIKSQGIEIKITNTQINKKANRTDIALMGMEGYSVLTNTEGWNFMPFQGQTKPEPMTPDDVKAGQTNLDFRDEFLTYKEKGKKLEDLGKDEIDGTEVFKLKLSGENGQETTFYIDITDFMIIQQKSKMNANGQEMENTTSFSNYQKAEEGIVLARSIYSDFGDMEVNKIELNPTIDESIFKISAE